MNKLFARAAMVLAALISFSLAGCGKDGMPEPDYTNQVFAFPLVEASLNDFGCLSVWGTVVGDREKLDFVTLDLQPVDGSCEGCPFVPQESARLEASEIWRGSSSDNFSFVYCPTIKADSYRWRLTGRNVFAFLPPAVGPLRTVSSVLSIPEASDASVTNSLNGAGE